MPRQSAVVHAHAASAVAVVQDAGLLEAGERPRQSEEDKERVFLLGVGEVPRPSEEEGVRGLLRLGLVEDAGVLHRSAEADAQDKAQRLSDSRPVRRIFYF